MPMPLERAGAAMRNAGWRPFPVNSLHNCITAHHAAWPALIIARLSGFFQSGDGPDG
jgi:hypothetical protein